MATFEQSWAGQLAMRRAAAAQPRESRLAGAIDATATETPPALPAPAAAPVAAAPALSVDEIAAIAAKAAQEAVAGMSAARVVWPSAPAAPESAALGDATHNQD